MTDSRPIFPVVFMGKSSENSTLDTSTPVNAEKPPALFRSVDGSNVRDFRPIIGGEPEAPKASPAQVSAEPSSDADSTSPPATTGASVIAEKENPLTNGSDGEPPLETQTPTSGSDSPLVATFVPSSAESPTSSSPAP